MSGLPFERRDRWGTRAGRRSAGRWKAAVAGVPPDRTGGLPYGLQVHPEQVLRQAVEAVARDLPPLHLAALEAVVEHRRWWLAQWPDGAAYVLGLLAQDVQEAVHASDPDWPACQEPTCPAVHAHALFVEPDLGADPFWTCHRTGLPVASVGQLGALPPPGTVG